MAIAPVLAHCVAAMVNAGVGVGPVDVATIGLSESLEVPIGTASVVLALVLGVLGAVGGVPPGPATFFGIPVFGPALTFGVSWLPEPTGAAAVTQFCVAFGLAAVLVSAIVALDVGVAPPEAVMLALQRRVPLSLGSIRVGQDIALVAAGLALGAAVGLGTLVVALVFGPVVALSLPITRRHVERRFPPAGPAPVVP